ncbi:hypothetical protein CLOLEP_02425 [[Clostridium] leptum DSM 753]|uniref:Uncharacterized protein n=1 Tax=[Clostridium] leptum DSM 753 TaxID=428125 RepID=A7VV20_9FIRM|nr:hypothetical protein CLOLEP_02425 [[Clostridium] leptum DSM 753]
MTIPSIGPKPCHELRRYVRKSKSKRLKAKKPYCGFYKAFLAFSTNDTNN